MCEHYEGNAFQLIGASNCFQLIDDVFFVPYAGDGMPIANFCTGSMTTFRNRACFVPGQNVTITCSLPNAIIIWDSPQFTLEALPLSTTGATSGTRLDGAIVFNLTNEIAGSPPCVTTTATIANIQESMQGLSLTCSDANNMPTVTIDVIGKLHVIRIL